MKESVAGKERRLSLLRGVIGGIALPFIMLAAFALSSACAPGENENKTIKDARLPDVGNLSSEGVLVYKYLVLWEALRNNDTDTADSMLRDLLELDPSPEIYAQAIAMHRRGKQMPLALELARRAVSLHPNAYNLQITLAELLEQSDKIDEALAVLRACSALDLTRDELTNTRQYIAFLLLHSEKLDEAAAYIAAIPKTERSAFIMFYEALILRRKGEADKAGTLLRALLKKHPDFTDAWMTLAQDMEKAGRHKQAAAYYQKALDSAPLTDIYLRWLKARLKFDDLESVTRQILHTSFNPEVKLRAAELLMDENHYKEARRVLASVDDVEAVADEVSLYLGIMAYESGEHIPEALERLRDITPETPLRARMLHVKALLHIRQGDYTAALDSARALRDAHPDAKDNWSFLAELANAAKNYPLAEGVCREGLAQWPEEVPLLYSLAMSLSFQEQNTEAIPVLEQILRLDGAYMMALNALGYILAEENRDLDRALILVNQALEQQPENVQILDSLAWVYYQMRNYPEAWRVIKKCAEKGITDAVIWDHYGDIALALHKNKDASLGYAKALELKHENSAAIRVKLEKLK